MSADPPTTNPGRFRCYITDIELQPPITDPNCKICVKVFVDDELVYSLPWLGNTQQLHWSRLITCDVSPLSRVVLKLFRNINGTHQSFHFPSYYVSELDKGVGKTTLEHPELVWIATIASLTPTVAGKIFPNELDKLNQIDGVYDNLKPDETTKYLLKIAMKFASIVAKIFPKGSSTLCFLLLVKTCEALEKQRHLDNAVQRLLQGLMHVQEVMGVLDQASNPMFAAAIDQSKEPINDILMLLEEISIYIFNRLTDTEVHIPCTEFSLEDTEEVGAYLCRLKELQQAFHNSWTPSIPSYLEPTSVEDNEPLGLAWYEIPASVTEPAIKPPGLVKKPLERLKSLSIPTTLVLVVDGLDECGDYDSHGKIIKKLYEMSQLVPWLKVIFTARPVGDIQEYFQKNCSKDPIIHIHNYDASNDICAYIRSKLGDLAQEEGWPDNSIEKLCTMAQGVFLWAALAVKYIKRSTLSGLLRLQRLLNNRKLPVMDHFDALYSSILKPIFDDDDDETKDAYSQCIGVIISTSKQESLPIPDLQHLLLGAGKIDQMTLDRILKTLGLILLINGRYARFHHSSFQDYIVNSSRSGDFVVWLEDYESEPAACCLQLMQRDLQFNVCKLESSQLLNKDVSDLESRIRLNITLALKYALTELQSSHGIEAFHGGTTAYVLDRVLSLLGCTDVATTGLSELASLDLAQYGDWDAIALWIKDAHRFILSFGDAIIASSPHLYISALAFSPAGSLTAQRMRPYFPNTITISQGTESDWHPCIKAVLHPHSVQSLSISSDGRRVAVGYLDGSLGVWDTKSDALGQATLTGHTHSVTCVVFSHDGNLIASGSYDATVQVWDIAGRLKTNHLLTGHSGSVHCVAFSPVSAVIASGSSDRTIRLWDHKSMRSIEDPYVGHLSRVSSVAFSPDGRKLISGSWDKTIRVWSVDPSNLQLARSPLVVTGHSESVTCVAVSPDGSRAASGSVDKTIQTYDLSDGTIIKPCNGLSRHLDSITSIAFSPDGKVIASSSLDGMVKLRDTTTLTEISRPFGHSNAINSIAFSPEGAYIVSGSADMTTCVWKFSLRRTSRPLKVAPFVGHSAAVQSIAFSRDGAQIVSGSGDNMVRVWDAVTGAPVGNPLNAHANPIYCVAISPNGTRVASGSGDGMIKLWDTTTRAIVHSHQSESCMRCIAFSPDGTLIAFGTNDSKVHLWDHLEWRIIGNPLLGHSGWASSVAFSPNGTSLASSSGDCTIIIWDIKTQGRLGNALQGHTGPVRSVAFAPCGTQLVSGSDDRTVRVWDIKTGNIIYQLDGHVGLVMSVAFSPDGLRIGSGSFDQTIRLWDTKTGQIIGKPFTGHSSNVRSIAFSPDGNNLISGSDDTTIQVWSLGASSEPPIAELSNELRDTFCWPPSPETSSNSRKPGWVTHDQQPLAFWLPAHYQQPDQFLSTDISAPFPKPVLDYSQFAYGTDWTAVACDSIKNSSN